VALLDRGLRGDAPGGGALPGGLADDPVLCPTCNAARLRAVGSALRPGAGPRPLPSLAEFRLRRKVEPERPAPRPSRKPRGPSPSERAEVELRRDPRRSSPAVAEAAGCSQPTAAKVRDRLEAAGAIPVVAYVFDARGRRIRLRRPRGAAA
jgi:hypothetical protein